MTYASPSLADASSQLVRLKQPELSRLSQVQPHGVLLVVQEPDLTVLQVSRNSHRELGLPPEAVLGQSLDQILDAYQVDQLRPRLTEPNLERLNPTKLWVRRQGDDYGVYDAIFHRSADGFLIVELEPAHTQESIPFLSFYHLAKASIGHLTESRSLQEFCRTIVHEVRQVTGFDRVMLYKFDDDGHGEVMAEEKPPEMESYLGLHFPESDIPQPARRMFRSNWIRVIPDAKAEPVELEPAMNPVTQRPTDLVMSVLRQPYRCHTQYLHHMQVGASLTISLMKDQQLWGLIACHHRTPKAVPYELRKTCEFLGQVVFAEISTLEDEADHHYRLRLNQVRTALVDQMAQEDYFIDGLVRHPLTLLDGVNAQGAAICFGNRWTTLGQTPSEEELNYLVQWLAKTCEGEVMETSALPLAYADAQRFKQVGSGLLAIPISKRSYVLWFRPEVIQTVNWGGDPNHPYTLEGEGDAAWLCPRQSFELWKETVQLHSLPWQPVEVEAALELRKAIVNIVLRQAEELALLAQDLERSNAELKKFAYVASHDLQEPLNQVANFVQLLEMRYDSALDQDAKEFIGFAVDGVSLMQTLIDDVLAYSKVDLQGIEWQLTVVQDSLEQALGNLRGRMAATEAQVTWDPMPAIVADRTQLMQLFQNLIGNAIKFRRPEVPPRIHVGVERQDDHWQFTVRDNGIGLDPQFGERIFVIFQRLHTRDEYAGSGMGLAICKKIVECHRGRIWVDSIPGEGSQFHFTIPVEGRDRTHGHGRKAQNYLFSRG